MITLQQLGFVKQSINFALQKIGRCEDAKADLLTRCTGAAYCTPSSTRKAERAVRHAETLLVAALDQLRDEIDPLIKEGVARGCNSAVASLQENR